MWGEKVKFSCKVFQTEHAKIPVYPLMKDHCPIFSQSFFKIPWCMREKNLLQKNVWFYWNQSSCNYWSQQSFWKLFDVWWQNTDHYLKLFLLTWIMASHELSWLKRELYRNSRVVLTSLEYCCHNVLSVDQVQGELTWQTLYWQFFPPGTGAHYQQILGSEWGMGFWGMKWKNPMAVK